MAMRERAIFLRQEAPGHMQVKTRIKIDSATALRAAPAPPKHRGRLERRRRSIRVEKSATTSPAGWRANGRQHGGGIFITRGGGGWLAADLQGEYDGQ